VKYADACAALDHYDYSSEPNDRGELCALPEHPAPVHALFKPVSRLGLDERRWMEYRSRAPVFLDRYSDEHAACMKRVKVVLSLPFDDEDPDACPACVSEALRRAPDPTAWSTEHQRRLHDRWARQREREEQEKDIASWREREYWRRRAEEEWRQGAGRGRSGGQ